jgi:parallel beta-helix repeat protein
VTQGWPGNGTEINPYLIEDQIITQQEKYNACIMVRNTTVHYVIRNCFLEAIPDGNAIYIIDTGNGKLDDCFIIGDEAYIAAVYIKDSPNMVITNCSIDGGVTASDCDWIEVLNCTINNNLSIHSSDNALVKNCKLSSTRSGDIVDISGEHCRIFDCNITGSGRAWGLRLRGYHNWFHVANISVSGCRKYGITMRHVEDSIIENCQIDNIPGDIGIEIDQSERIIIHNNTITNTGIGILGYYSSSCDIYNNTVSQSSDTNVVLESSHNFSIISNTMFFGQERGVTIDDGSTGTGIYGNRIGWNKIGNAIDNGTLNTWWDGIDQGNAWSDYDCSGIYSIPGEAGLNDSRPTLLSAAIPWQHDCSNMTSFDGVGDSSWSYPPNIEVVPGELLSSGSYIHATSFGTGSLWHGALRYLTLPSFFYLSNFQSFGAYLEMDAETEESLGMILVSLHDTSNNPIMTISVNDAWASLDEVVAGVRWNFNNGSPWIETPLNPLENSAQEPYFEGIIVSQNNTGIYVEVPRIGNFKILNHDDINSSRIVKYISVQIAGASSYDPCEVMKIHHISLNSDLEEPTDLDPPPPTTTTTTTTLTTSTTSTTTTTSVTTTPSTNQTTRGVWNWEELPDPVVFLISGISGAIIVLVVFVTCISKRGGS